MSAATIRRIGLVGAGMVSQFHLAGWKSLGDRAHVVAIADPSADNARRRADAFGVSEIYDSVDALLASAKVDAIDIAAPREVHAMAVLAAADRGIPVLCQKPLAPTLAQAEALIAAVDCRTRLMVHENWRFRPYYRDIKRWLNDGRTGRVVQVAMNLWGSGMLPDASGQRPALERQPFMLNLDRMLVTEVLIHHIDTLRFLFGPLRLAHARLGRTYSELRGEDRATLLFETAAGAQVVLQSNLAVHGADAKMVDRLHIIGEQGAIVLDGASLHSAGRVDGERHYDLAAAYQASYDATLKHFLDCLDSGEDFETSPEDNLQTLRLVEAVYEMNDAQVATEANELA